MAHALYVAPSAPKGSTVLGGPESKFPKVFEPARLTKAIAKGGKAGILLAAIAEAGPEGADLVTAGISARIKPSNVTSYPSFDVRNAFGVRIAKLPSGKVVLFARPGIYSARVLAEAIAAGIAERSGDPTEAKSLVPGKAKA